jgi:SSS family solute:Na+ symporter
VGEVNRLFLAWFLVYLAAVLGIGVWGWRKVRTQADFATADRSMGLLLGVGTMFASFMSALTVVGGVGYASRFGWAFMTLYSLGALGGMAFLAVTAPVWQRTRVNSVSELMGLRYDSRALQAVMSSVIVFTYAIILVAQLFGVGFIIEGTLGIPMWLGILAVGLFFVVYTILGGMMAIARTDLFQAIVMTTGVLAMFFSLVLRLRADPAVSLSDAGALMTIYAGQTPDNLGVLALFLVFGLGIAIHPYYVQRVMSARDVATARLIPALNAALLVLFYLLITTIGIVGSLYLPERAGDAMAPAIIAELMGGTLGAIAMMAIVAGVQSTTDSLLHIVGVYLSQDVYEPWVARRDLGDEGRLFWARVFTAAFGVVVVAVATLEAFTGELALIAVIGAYAWGILGGSLFVPIAAGLFWRRATREGALVAVVLGFLGGVGGGELQRAGVIRFHPIFLAVGVSLAGMVVASLMTRPVDGERLDRVLGRSGGRAPGGALERVP